MNTVATVWSRMANAGRVPRYAALAAALLFLLVFCPWLAARVLADDPATPAVPAAAPSAAGADLDLDAGRPKEYAEDGVVRYWWRVTNNGPEGSGPLNVGHYLNRGEVLSASTDEGVDVSCEAPDDNHWVYCSTPTLAPGAQVTIQFTVRADVPVLEQSGSVKGETSDPNEANNVDGMKVYRDGAQGE